MPHKAEKTDSPAGVPPGSSDAAYFPAWFHDLFASRTATWLVLALAACLSLPAFFAGAQEVGLEGSWNLSVQLAAADGKVFGRGFVFTYGPLGWLLIHFPVSKAGLLLYDFFILGSLLSIYQKLLPERPRPFDALMVLAVAAVTKAGFSYAPAAILFAVMCYWLWMVYESGNVLALVCGLVATQLVFFSKVNYALILIFLIPAFGLGLLFLGKGRRISGLLMLAGFPLLMCAGSAVWRVDLSGYLRSACELIAGYNDAMFLPAQKSYPGFELACLFLSCMIFVAIRGRACLPWKGQVVILPLIGAAALLLFKNSFVRFDKTHYDEFNKTFPLLLAVWCVAWRSQRGVKILLAASLFYPLASLAAETSHFGRKEIAQVLPVGYFREMAAAPWRETSADLQRQLRARFPEQVFPDAVTASIGKATVDVMPWESSLAVLNGLNLDQRPVLQSYSAYTPWLDGLNARFLSSSAAPDFMIYACASEVAIDGRPSAWDESITKRALLENYTFETEFTLPMRVWADEALEPAPVFLLKKTPGARRLVAVMTNEVSVNLDQPLNLPLTTNLLFLTLKVERTLPGKLRSFLFSPAMLRVTFQNQDGSSEDYRAVLAILQTGVLVNRRVESPDEIRNWLQFKAGENMAVSSICFRTASRWGFRTPFKGVLVEYRLEQSP